MTQNENPRTKCCEVESDGSSKNGTPLPGTSNGIKVGRIILRALILIVIAMPFSFAGRFLGNITGRVYGSVHPIGQRIKDTKTELQFCRNVRTDIFAMILTNDSKDYTKARSMVMSHLHVLNHMPDRQSVGDMTLNRMHAQLCRQALEAIESPDEIVIAALKERVEWLDKLYGSL